MSDVSRILLILLLFCYVIYLNVEIAGTSKDYFDIDNEEDADDGEEEDSTS